MRVIGKVDEGKEKKIYTDAEKSNVRKTDKDAENDSNKTESNNNWSNTTGGLVNIAKKYGLSGPVLSQDRIDEIIKTFKNRRNKEK